MARCEDCGHTLPAAREDTLCEDCRRDRIILKRGMREPVTLCEVPATFSAAKN